MRSLLTILTCITMLTGCASSGGHDAATNGCPHAECLVCKTNADLACVDVAVDSTTPRVESNGKTYYFCSEECRDCFQRTPAKYVAR